MLYPAYTVLQASTGAESRQLLAAQRPDLILLDLSLPDIDGATLCRELKSEPSTASIPVVLMSGRSAQELQTAVAQSGADASLLKRFRMATLEQLVTALLS